jgi:GT2 family glycosyltransferase
MTGKQAVAKHTADTVRAIWKPRRVLDGSGGESALIEAFQAQGIEAERAGDGPEGIYDLATCLEPDAEPGSLVDSICRHTDKVLFSPPLSNSAPVTWLHSFAREGFSPDLQYRGVLPSDRMVLLRRGGSTAPEDVLMLLADLWKLSVRQDEVEKTVRELRVAVAEVREMENSAVEKLDNRLAQLQARTNQLFQQVHGILRSRIWRCLTVAGGLALRVAGLLRLGPMRPAEAGPSVEEGDIIIQVWCDEPRQPGETPVSGTITFRGWAVASSGIESVEIRVGNLGPFSARYGLYRPDIARAFPSIPQADRSGFQVDLDTMALPNGRHSAVLRGTSMRGAQTEIRIPLLVDHVHGFATEYYRWIAEYEKRDAKLIEMKMAGFSLRPLISVVMPVYRTAPAILEKALASVMAQSYPNWELCIVDDHSLRPEIDTVLERYAAGNARIRITRLPANAGIANASNMALNMSAGEYVALLDHDDELAPDALYHVVEAINRRSDADLLYSDEDHIDESGVRSDPFFKPEWSPDLALAENYVCHLMVFKRSLAQEVGGFRGRFDLSQDHDLLLRMSQRARNIVHIPRILYHWRTCVYTMQRASHYEERAQESTRAVIEDFLRASGTPARVERGAVPGRWRVRYDVPVPPRVAIIIATAGKGDRLEACLEGLRSRTGYRPCEVLVIDNSRQNGRVEQLAAAHGARTIDWRGRPFNFSEMNNHAARQTDAPLLLFLNDDITVIREDWLGAMVELAARREVGAVGAKLLYPDGRIQHAGVALGIFEICGHAFKGCMDDQRTYFDFPDLIRNVSAVTGACMMVPAERFWEVGGFDSAAFPVAYNDIDLCLKLGRKGYRVLYTPHACLHHFEAFSKSEDQLDPGDTEIKTFQQRWKDVIAADPYYNPNLSRTREDYSFRKRTA